MEQPAGVRLQSRRKKLSGGFLSSAPARVGDRRIIHFDMDAFFAAVEQRDFPRYAGKPLIVGGSPNKRGVVATCSYEARRYGVHSAMSSARAARLCPSAIFVKPRFEVYRRVSAHIRAIFLECTDLVEMPSLDEAYLDVSESAADVTAAVAVAREIKRRIARATRLTASAGVSCNKFIAKIASDMDKPDGCYVVPAEHVERFVENLPVAKFHGVGKVTRARMKRLGIATGADLKRRPLDELVSIFGSAGYYYYDAARGLDERPVVAERARKSVGAETTFENDLRAAHEIAREVRRRALEVARILQARGLSGYTVTLKVKYADFVQITRSRTLDHPLTGLREMLRLLSGLLQKTEAGARPVRLLGVTVSNLCAPGTPRQTALALSASASRAPQDRSQGRGRRGAVTTPVRVTRS